LKIYEAIKKILKDNDILPSEEEKKSGDLSLIVKTVLDIQKNLI
jgi:hypothetical protein